MFANGPQKCVPEPKDRRCRLFMSLIRDIYGATLSFFIEIIFFHGIRTFDENTYFHNYCVCVFSFLIEKF